MWHGFSTVSPQVVVSTAASDMYIRPANEQNACNVRKSNSSDSLLYLSDEGRYDEICGISMLKKNCPGLNFVKA